VYPTFDLGGVLFDLDRSQGNRWMHRLHPRLAEALGKKMVLPQRKVTSLEGFSDGRLTEGGEGTHGQCL